MCLQLLSVVLCNLIVNILNTFAHSKKECSENIFKIQH